jgi:hypothetical protein
VLHQLQVSAIYRYTFKAQALGSPEPDLINFQGRYEPHPMSAGSIQSGESSLEET